MIDLPSVVIDLQKLSLQIPIDILYSSIGNTFEENFDIDLYLSTIMTTSFSNTDNRPAHLFFGRDLPINEINDIIKKITNSPCRIVPCTSWAEVAENFKLKPIGICVSVCEINRSTINEITNMVGTLSSLICGNKNISITVGIRKSTDYSIVKQLQKSNILGIVPYNCDFGLEESIKALTAQWSHIPYWPKHILEQLPGATTNKKITTHIKLTARQEQIFSIITTKGASNKSIAKMLNITESTVKLHMGQILKKYGVKNRTQLVAFTKHEV